MKHPLLVLALASLVITGAAAQDALDLYRNRKYEDAIAVTLKEIEVNKSNMDAYSVLGWSLNNLKRYSEAVDYGRRAWNINKSDHRIVGILAEAYYGLRQDGNALEFYQRFVYMGLGIPGWDPRYLRDAYRDIGEILIRYKEFHRADIALSASVAYDRGRSALDPVRSARIHARLGWAREQAGEKDSAKTAYQAALAKDPKNTEAKEGLDRLK